MSRQGQLDAAPGRPPTGRLDRPARRPALRPGPRRPPPGPGSTPPAMPPIYTYRCRAVTW